MCQITLNRVYPRYIEDVAGLLRRCQNLEIDTYFIGEGANLLVSDAGYRGVMIHLAKHMHEIIVDDKIIKAEAGAMLKDVVLLCEQYSLGGMEYLSGISGKNGRGFGIKEISFTKK